jgi:PASTA domain-containing protein
MSTHSNGVGMRSAALVAAVGACLLLFAGGASASVRWGSATEAALPANAATGAKQDVQINSVSCSSVGNCSAVGSYVDGSGAQQGLLLTETGGTWATGVEASLPADAATNPDVFLNQISCGSAGNCSAVGEYSDSSGNGQGLLLTETAGVWGTGVEPAPPANAATASEVGLVSVSCASAGNCTAVGGYLDDSNNFQGLLLTETAGVWGAGIEAQLPPKAASSQQEVALNSVSCGSPGNCSAVGGYLNSSGGAEGLLLNEKAGNWGTGLKAPLPANAATSSKYAGDVVLILAVSCASTGDCSAVGNYCAVGNCNNFNNSGSAKTGEEGLLLTEKAGHWETGVEAKLPANADKTGPMQYLNSISCASAGNCSAAGSYFDSASKDQLVLLTQSGGSWGRGIEPALPANAAADQEELGVNAVSCFSPGNCTVSGNYSRGLDNTQGLLLTQIDGVWATGAEADLPANAATKYQLAWITVSCASAKSCTGVGSYTDSSGGTQGLLSADSPSRGVVMPNLRGQTLASAERWIRSHGCPVGKIRHASSSRMKKGRVISQQPKAGTRLRHRLKVSLVVSTGRP